MIASGIDHVVIAVPNLDQSREEFQALGFVVTPKAIHERFGTANHLTVFGSTYIELISVENSRPEDRTSYDILVPCIAAGGGIPMLALATNDAMATYQALIEAGASVEKPLTWSRDADTPDGRRRASFTTLFPQSTLLPDLFAFFCHHHTPELVFQHRWKNHPNGTAGVAGIERYVQHEVRDHDQGPGKLLGNHRLVMKSDGALQIFLGNQYVSYRRTQEKPHTRMVLRVQSLEKLDSAIGARGLRTEEGKRLVPLNTVRGTSLLFVPESTVHD